MKPVKTWILIADGASARIVEQKGAGHELLEVPGSELQSDNMQNRDINADRPGRSFDSKGKGRHAMEQAHEPKEMQEKDFLKQVSDYVGGELSSGRFDRLVIVAPPTALGYLRTMVSNPVKQALSAEVSKDLTNVPNTELAKHLGDVLAV